MNFFFVKENSNPSIIRSSKYNSIPNISKIGSSKFVSTNGFAK